MKFLLSFFTLAFIFSNGIYDYQITDIHGNSINLDSLQGKKILFVNTASNSQYVNQYASLEQLYEKYQDSLVIIAVPSNAYNNEPYGNDSIDSFVKNTFNIHYILCSKINVTGDSIAPIYQWLTDSSLNHVFQNPVNGDFFKYLVDENGHSIAIFDGSVDPMDNQIQSLITNQ